jgi:hypothetical protein
VLGALERAGDNPRDERELALLREVRRLVVRYDSAENRRAGRRIDVLLGHAPADELLPLGDPWSAALLDALGTLDDQDVKAARALVAHAAVGRAAKPSGKALATNDALLAEHGAERCARVLGRLLDAARLPVSGDRGGVPPEVGDVLRGLCWLAASSGADDRLAAAVGGWLVAGWTKVPGHGPACRKAASGAAWALPRMGDAGAAQLGRARALVKQPQAVAEVDTAIDAAAEALGIPREEFEERVVPTLGLVAPARREVELGEHRALLSYARGKARLEIAGPDGKVRKSVPAAVRRDHAVELAGLKALAKDVTSMLAAQRLRLERLLLDERIWEVGTWRARYLDQPLVSVLARNLIWQLERPDERICMLYADGELRDVEGQALAPGPGERISLWHPATAPRDEVAAWRRRVEDTGVVQPFKQAHREVYLLTDAERATDVYSNRFAGHILRQHQFAALARGRGWRYALQGAFDSPDEQAELLLPTHGLIASFWVDRPWDAEDDYSDAGIFNHVLTDQVRFSDQNGADRHLRDIPLRVLSEVLRDVDLFVGVASIGNDPSWQDSGGMRRETWGDYWSGYSFGELGAAAEVRRDLLARLLPKLAIAGAAELDDRFLRVRGTKRTYKIHLGSGNILMEPNDQYLCIVPGRRAEGASGVMLPFEGDQLLSIILSKAMMLAADDRIADRTITSQISQR